MESEEIMTIAVSIGRSIGDEPMPLHAWQDFKDRTFGAIKSCHLSLILATTDGHGTYVNAKGKTIEEDTAIFLAQIRKTDVQPLQIVLAGLGYIYVQEGIGFTAAPANQTFIPSERYNTERK